MNKLLGAAISFRRLTVCVIQMIALCAFVSVRRVYTNECSRAALFTTCRERKPPLRKSIQMVKTQPTRASYSTSISPGPRLYTRLQKGLQCRQPGARGKSSNVSLESYRERSAKFTGALLLYVQKNVVLGQKLSGQHQPVNAVLY